MIYPNAFTMMPCNSSMIIQEECLTSTKLTAKAVKGKGKEETSLPLMESLDTRMGKPATLSLATPRSQSLTNVKQASYGGHLISHQENQQLRQRKTMTKALPNVVGTHPSLVCPPKAHHVLG
jgi:hypothetical protein